MFVYLIRDIHVHTNFSDLLCLLGINFSRILESILFRLMHIIALYCSQTSVI